MHITLNGEAKPLAQQMTLNDLVLSMDLNPQSLVAEVNGIIVEHGQFRELMLQDGDRVELIRFVGGG